MYQVELTLATIAMLPMNEKQQKGCTVYFQRVYYQTW